MTVRNWLVVFLAMILVLGLVGCSSQEKGFILTINEMNSLELSERTGEVSINFNNLPPGFADGQKKALINSLANKYSIAYNIKTDFKKNLAEAHYYFIDKATGNKKEILTALCVGDTYYIKIDEVVKLAELFGDANTKAAIGKYLGGAAYISLDAKDFEGLFDDYFNLKEIKVFLPVNLEQTYRQTLMFNKLSHILTNDVFEGFNSDAFLMDGNKYILSLNASGTIRLCKAIALYSLDNADKLNAGLKKFINSLDDGEMKMLGLNPGMKDSYMNDIDEMTEFLKAGDQSRVSAVFAEIEKEYSNNSDKFDGKMVATLEKLDQNTYSSKFDLKIYINEFNGPLSFAVSGVNTTKRIDSFDVRKPDYGVKGAADLKKQLENTLKINLNQKTCTTIKGGVPHTSIINAKVIRGYTYLPLRQVGELFAEQVGWDKVSGKAYVLKNGIRIDMQGIIIGDRTYVKIRDFEKLGYTVLWFAKTNTVTIIK